MTEQVLIPATIIKDPTELHDLDLVPDTIAITAEGSALQLGIVLGARSDQSRQAVLAHDHIGNVRIRSHRERLPTHDHLAPQGDI